MWSWKGSFFKVRFFSDIHCKILIFVLRLWCHSTFSKIMFRPRNIRWISHHVAVRSHLLSLTRCCSKNDVEVPLTFKLEECQISASLNRRFFRRVSPSNENFSRYFLGVQGTLLGVKMILSKEIPGLDATILKIYWFQSHVLPVNPDFLLEIYLICRNWTKRSKRSYEIERKNIFNLIYRRKTIRGIIDCWKVLNKCHACVHVSQI